MKKRNESSSNDRDEEHFRSKKKLYRALIVFDIFFACYDSVLHRTVLAIVMGFCAILMLNGNKKHFGSYW